MRFAIAILLALPAAAQPYSITLLPHPTPDGVRDDRVNGVSNAGVPIGTMNWRNQDGQFSDSATIWRAGRAWQLGNAVGNDSSGSIVDSQGRAVLSGNANLYLWDNGAAYLLARPGTYAATVSAMNENLLIVGEATYFNGSPPVSNSAAAWQNGVFTPLPFTSAMDVNQDGLIVGRDGLHACAWRDGVLTDLSPDAYQSIANAVNDAGMIVGREQAVFGGPWIACRWTRNGTTWTRSTLGTESTPLGISNDGDVLLDTHTVLRNGVATNLMSAIPPNLGWQQLNATAMNAAGQIVGTGPYGPPGNPQVRGFLMTPPTCAEIRRGDANCDGALNNFDIDPFVEVVLAGNADWWSVEHPTCNMLCSLDMNNDGALNNFDIDPFVARLLGE